MTSYDKIMSVMDEMSEDELAELAEIMDMYKFCQGDDRKLFMYATKSFVRDKFFTTFIDAEIKN